MHTIFLATSDRIWFLRTIVSASATSEVFQQLKLEQNLRRDHTIAVLLRDCDFIVANESKAAELTGADLRDRNVTHIRLTCDIKQQFRFVFDLPQFRRVR